MSFLKRWSKRARLLVRKDSLERELDQEMQLHLDLEIQKNIRAGMTAEEAKRQAHISFGGVERYKQQAREARMFDWVGGLSLDFKLGVRMLIKHPGLAVVGGIGLAVAMAIGASTFTIIDEIVDPAGLPVDEPDRVISVQNIDTRENAQVRRTHLHDLRVWRSDLTTVSEIGAYRSVDRNLVAGDGAPESVRVAEIESAALRIARTTPFMGRTLEEADEQPDAPPVALIGYDLWQSRFAADPNVLGRTLELAGATHTIVGVMPDGFGFPIRNRVWTPLRLRAIDFAPGNAPSVSLVGRLAEGVSLTEAQTQADGIAARMAADDPTTHDLIRTHLNPYSRSFVDSPVSVWILHGVQGLISLILVVIGINVAILVYARTATRAAEIAVRTALGASRMRVVSQLFAEALVLSTVAAVGGLAAAQYVLHRLGDLVWFWLREEMPYWWDFGLSAGTVLYAAGLAVLAAVIVGVIPALKATGPRVHAALKHAGNSAGPLGRTWTLLIVGQVAIAVAALPVPLSTVTKWVRFGGEEPEFTTHDFLTATLFLDQSTLGPGDEPASAFRTDHRIDGDVRKTFFEQREEFLRRLEAEPGVVSVIPTGGSPLETTGNRVELEHSPAWMAAKPGDRIPRGGPSAITFRNADMANIDTRYFSAFGVPIRSGRGLDVRDLAMEPTAVVVNEAFVEHVLEGNEAVGSRFRMTYDRTDGSEQPWLEIVGVVANFPGKPDPKEARPVFYRPIDLRHNNENPQAFAIRVRGKTPAEMIEPIRRVALSVDPMLRFGELMPLDDWLYENEEDERILVLLLVASCLSAVLLSAAGISALMSFTVSQRRREIGVRLALGASRKQVLLTVISRAARQLSYGVAAGLVLVALLFIGGKESAYSGTLLVLGSAVSIVAVGALATLGPAREGMRVQPTEALKGE